ncbi:MAG: flagellar capping protein FliD, partial [Maribacter sp.]
AVYRGIERSTYGPTTTHKNQLQLVKTQLEGAKNRLDAIQQNLETVYTQLKAAGAPYVEE